jgi:hypothetical protein
VSEFRDAIAKSIEDDWEVEVETVHPHDDAPYALVAILATPDELADSLLAMPEMQAIRKALIRATYNAALWSYPAAPEPPMATYMRERCELPESVIAWVLDEGSNP